MPRPYVYSLPFLVAAASFVACNTPPLETPRPTDQTVVSWPIAITPHDKIDILFMVDNSGSMDAMQSELRNRFGQFFTPFQEIAKRGKKADLHIGVVTSDYGAGHGAPGCSSSPGGGQGRLQALGARAATGCKRPLDANFIQFKFDDDGNAASSNLPQGQNLLETFTCMASVGASGCGFEHQLESVYAALHDAIPDNAGFLRDDALLVVVFLTNEDDASAPPDTDIYDRSAPYHLMNSYSRQTNYAVVCCPPGLASCTDDQLTFPPYDSSNGPLAGCRPAPNFPTGAGPGKQYDVSRYIDFFTHPASQGGVKKFPSDVILVGIDAPDEPFEVVLSNPGAPSGVPLPICDKIDEQTGNCLPVLQHSCMNPVHREFFGDPAVRLNTVIRAARNSSLHSICDDDYSESLGEVAAEVIVTSGEACVAQALPRDPSNPSLLRPDCSVDEVTPNEDGTTTRSYLAQCPIDGSPASGACWKIEAKATCGVISPDGVGFTIDRNGAPPPPAGTIAEISCAVAM